MQNNIINLLVLGPRQSGKTTWITQMFTGEYTNQYTPTKDDYTYQYSTYANGTKYDLNIVESSNFDAHINTNVDCVILFLGDNFDYNIFTILRQLSHKFVVCNPKSLSDKKNTGYNQFSSYMNHNLALPLILALSKVLDTSVTLTECPAMIPPCIEIDPELLIKYASMEQDESEELEEPEDD